MALLSDYISGKKFDVRMLRRDLASHQLSQAEIEKNEKQLEDDTENAQYVKFQTLVDDHKKS